MITVEEANTFLEATKKYAARIAPAVSLCVLSPVVLLWLLGMAGAKRGAVTENVAGGIGLIVLLLMVVVAVAVFLLTGIPYNKYEYLEKEKLTLQYGVSGIVEKAKETFAGTYRICITLGVVLCILGVVPLLAVSVFFGNNGYAVILATDALLIVVAIAVWLFVWSGIIWGDSISVVVDTGTGIHPEDLPHLFKRFYRSRFAQDTPGIGLGLPLAKSIVEVHGGTLEVESELGRGTAFTILLRNRPAPAIPTKL